MVAFKGLDFEEFLRKAPSGSRDLIQAMRRRVRERYPDVVEEVRFHRIVFGRKSIWRKFLDIRPLPDGVELDLRVGQRLGDETRFGVIREGGWVSLAVRSHDELDELLGWFDKAHSLV